MVLVPVKKCTTGFMVLENRARGGEGVEIRLMAIKRFWYKITFLLLLPFFPVQQHFKLFLQAWCVCDNCDIFLGSLIIHLHNLLQRLIFLMHARLSFENVNISETVYQQSKFNNLEWFDLRASNSNSFDLTLVRVFTLEINYRLSVWRCQHRQHK